MRELSLKEVQNESLNILSVIDDLCNQNDISYSLGYGALIGAVRHHGFIPWDDDIDIVMTRANYEKFLRMFNLKTDNSLKGMKLYAPELGNCNYCISRICETQKTIVRKYFQWSEENTGIWIDLFPIDPLPDEGVQRIRKQVELCFNICGANVPISNDLGFKRILKILYKKIKYGRYDINDEIKNYLNSIKTLDYSNNSEFLTNFGSPYGEKDIHREQVFSNYKRVMFENVEVSIISNYDEYLSNIYGDYMKLPPKKNQVRGHTENKYYWKSF